MNELRPKWAWVNGRMQAGAHIRVDSAGRIAAVEIGEQVPDPELAQTALLPGFVNAHSHAFQWGLRGAVQQAGRGDHFFSWREHMFRLAERLDESRIGELSRAAFTAMRAAGYTCVGEFHYVHHRPDGSPHQLSYAMAAAVIQAAREVGIRICLLHAAYFRPSPLSTTWAAGQRRFGDSQVEGWLARHQELAAAIDDLSDPAVSLGLAPHSVRAVSASQLARLSEVGDGPLHVHVNEQPREIEECLVEHGVRPLEVLARAGLLGPRTTLVHMTHASAEEMGETRASGARICFCPTTERDLGDGIGPAIDAARRGIPLCIGSDSHAQIDPFAEMRLLEGHERLRAGARLLWPARDQPSAAANLLRLATLGGAEALEVGAGVIEAGAWADFVEIDLDDPDLRGVPVDVLAEVIVYGATPRAVRATWVGGQRRATAEL